ncbi:hypothetical protein FRC04_004397 [Tulasnella sp. 424]|nr:hypothetical protein FRC04_004397 [Tulasnella sp. 424]KAG8979508.1 hypothetical protein FRC05_008497 [Tulasnella sp. 425]
MSPHTANLAMHNRSRNPTPNYQLPVELGTFILQLLFPDTEDSRRSKKDMAELYSLRLVSKSWKELVENTPTLWTYIKATDYPIPVIRDCLRRSKNYPLRITILHFPMFDDPPKVLIQYLQLLQPHSSRWKSMSCTVWDEPGPDDEYVRNFLESPAPILQSIYANFSTPPLVPTINLADGQAKNLKHLDLQSIALPWSSNLLSGLETFCLGAQDTIPVEEVINLFVKSPDLRRFELSCHGTEGQNNQTALIAPALDTIAHSLEEAVISTLPHIASQILSRISMPRCRSLKLSTDFTILGDGIDTLDDALVQFMPKIGDALNLGGRTTLTFLNDIGFEWRSSSKYDAFDFSLEFSGVELEILIEWIRNLATASGSQLELEVTLRTSDLGLAQRLGEWTEITKLSITSEFSEFHSYEEDEITLLLDFLGNPKLDTIDGFSWSWTFPNLQELDLRPSGYGPMKVFNMFHKRYFPDTFVQAIEGSGLAIQPPPKLDVWVEYPIEPAEMAFMTALENHWGVKGLNRVELASEELEISHQAFGMQ